VLPDFLAMGVDDLLGELLGEPTDVGTECCEKLASAGLALC
jgi:hypothetical protein